MEIGKKINFPEKGPMRGQYKYYVAKKFCMFYFTVINSEDLASVLLEMFVLINLLSTLTQARIRVQKVTEGTKDAYKGAVYLLYGNIPKILFDFFLF